MMAYEFTRVGIAAGGRIADIWDAIVISNAKWSVYDAAVGTNAKTYRCYDAPNNVDFYVFINDNQADYSILQLWEGWDSGSHVGTGDSLTDIAGDPFYVYSSRGVHVCVSDHRVLLGGSSGCQSYYIGQPIRFDTTKNMPFYIGSTTPTNWYGTLGRYDTAGEIAWRTLWDHFGTVGKKIWPLAPYSFRKYVRTCRGTYVFEDTVVYTDGEFICLGYLDGVCSLSNTVLGFKNGEVITCEDADWLILGGTHASIKYWSALRLQ